MKKKWIKWIATFFVCTMLACCFTSCGDKKKTSDSSSSNTNTEQSSSDSSTEMDTDGISFKTLTVNGTDVYGKVSNATTEFSFVDEVQTSGNVKYLVALDKNGMQTVITKTVTLKEGDNVFYVFETLNNEITSTYEVSIRRRPMYEVVFHTNGGNAVESQTVEEDGFASVPNTTRAGYTFKAWDYDFSTPITKNTEIKASWTVNTDTPYTVEYYLQNLENDEYTKTETVNETGTTDTAINAEIKTFAHFTYVESDTDKGTIAPDGSTVLKVYYTRNKYVVTFKSNAGTLASGTESQEIKYGANAVAPVYTRAGYTYKFDKTFVNISEPITVTAQWIANNDTPYKIEYYLENLEDSQYTKKETVNKTGTTDTTANAEIKMYPHFTHTQTASVSENIAGDGTTVLKVYYTRNTYTVTFNGNGGALTSGTETQEIKYGGKAKAPAYNKTGYSFTQYDKTFDNITESITVTAEWKINQYTLTIVYGNEQENTVITQDYNTQVAPVQNPTRAGYAFINWDKIIPAQIPAENITVTAQWQALFELDTGTLTGLTDYTKNNYTEIIIPNAIDGVNVTAIGDRAFNNCSNLTKIVLPDGVTTVPKKAFMGCSALQYNVEGGLNYLASNSTKYFYLDSAPTEIRTASIVDGCKIVGEDAFNGCEVLTNVAIADSVILIGKGAFGKCGSLQGISIPNGITHIFERTFYNCYNLVSVNLPDSVTVIGENAFVNCGKLINVNLPKNLNTLESGAFFGCTSLASVDIPVGITAIKESVFYGCTALTNVKFHNLLTIIDMQAFYGCSALINLTLPDNLNTIGFEAFENCRSLTNINIPMATTVIRDCAFRGSGLTSITLPNVNTIGNSVFENCTNLASVTIGEAITTLTIGANAFAGCNSLTEMTLPFFGKTRGDETHAYFGYIFGATSYTENATYVPASLRKVTLTNMSALKQNAFYNCGGLTSITISTTTTTVYYNSVFTGCTSLIELTLPYLPAELGRLFGAPYNDTKKNSYVPASLKRVTITSAEYNIPKDAFYTCSGLTSVHLPNGIKSIGDYAFAGCTGLTSINVCDTTAIGEYAFSSCTNLQNVNLENGLVSMGVGAFSGCTSLKRIDIPSTLSTIRAVFGGSGLKMINIPNGVKVVEKNAFRECMDLTSVVVADSVTTIGDLAFYGCNSLTDITLPFLGNTTEQPKTAYLGRIFGAVSYAQNPTYVPVSLRTVTLTSSVEVPSYAFYHCSNLTKVSFPKSEYIGSYAFYGCSALTSVSIPEGTTGIGNNAFGGCSSLEEINIPNGIYGIGEGVFAGCSSLSNIVLSNDIHMIGDYAFSGCSSLTNVMIGLNVSTIGQYAFYNCNGIECIYFKGSPNGWENVSIGSGNSCITSEICYFYSEAVPALNADGTAYDGNYWHYDTDGVTPVVWVYKQES